MKHFKMFNDINSYNIFKQSERYIKPNISLINSNNSIYYDPIENEVIEDPLKDYDKVQYIGSTNGGCQYIDLGCNLIENSDDIRIQFGISNIMKNTNNVSTCEILSCLKDGDNNHGIRIRIGGDKLLLNTKFAITDANYSSQYNSWETGVGSLGIEGYETEYDINVHCADLTTFNVSNDFTTILFAGMSSNNNIIQRYSVMRYTYLKIYKSNKLIRDLVPVTRKSDDKPGLFDLVNKVFYINSGSNEFITGPKIRNYNFKLPNLWSKIQGVESTGNSYIKIPECLDLKTGDHIKFDYFVYLINKGNDNNSQSSLFNIGYNGEPDGICLHWNDGKPQFKYPNATKNNFNPNTNVSLSKLDGTNYFYNIFETTSTTDQLWGLSLFARSNSTLPGTVDRYIKGIIYYFYIYINDELVIGLDPVKDNLGNIGLYDIVNKQFYTSMSETPFITSPQ